MLSTARATARQASTEAKVEIEQRVIGSQLRGDSGAVETALDTFRESHSAFHPPHNLIQPAIFDAFRDGTAISPNAIALRLADKDFDGFDIRGYLVDVLSSAPAAVNLQAEAAEWRNAVRLHFRERAAAQFEQDRRNGDPKAIETLEAELARIEAFQRSPSIAGDLAIIQSGAFVEGFVPPDYLLDGILQRGFIYSFTGQTGSGKTAISLRIMAHAALGKPLAGRDVQQCRVLMLAGENHTDVQMRWILLAERMGFVPSDMPVDFVPRVFSIESFLPSIARQAKQGGGYGLVIVDTSAAYFQGDDENSNVDHGAHARMLRKLTEIEGRPCALVNAHPVKGARDENLLPRGGGAFLAEVDGNVTCARKDGAVEVHWQGKFRGPEFEPMAFACETARSDFLKDSRGRCVPSVYARPLSESEQATLASQSNADMAKLLCIMLDNPGLAISALAEGAGWVGAGGPHKSKVARLLGKLKEQGLAAKQLGTWTLTPAGEKAAKARQE
ncbi:MAG TPA: AAA family ATPase [Rhizomicrobium sp.]|jgi:hypothetical protein|nr:AAA family ATPase [Rhizomicrobium sp.]